MSILLLEHVPLSTYKPAIEFVQGNVAGSFAATPKGVILHGTRSGQDHTVEQEYQKTLDYVRNGAGGLGWSVTVGGDKLCVHLSANQWGWNARESSKQYLAIEFAQARLGDWITDGQIRAAAYWIAEVREAWLHLPLEFPNHSDLPSGQRDGKSDVEPRGEHTVRDRLLARLRDPYGLMP